MHTYYAQFFLKSKELTISQPVVSINIHNEIQLGATIFSTHKEVNFLTEIQLFIAFY